MGTRLVPSEDQEQVALVQWLEINRICYAHIPNGGYRNAKEGAKFKRLGVKAGLADILVFDPPPATNHKGTAIELKRRKGGKTSPEQTEWLERLRSRGWAAEVCKGAGEAIEFLQKLGYGRRKR